LDSHGERAPMKSWKSLKKKLRKRARWRARVWVVALAVISLGALTMVYRRGDVLLSAASLSVGAQSNDRINTPIVFGEMNGNDVYNASGVVPLADSRFLFCDNKSNDALFELDLTADGQKKGPLIRRPLQGLAAGAMNDPEAMTLAREKGLRFVFV